MHFNRILIIKIVVLIVKDLKKRLNELIIND